jgi:hypothetical protein
MHFTDFVEFDELIGNLTHLTTFHFDENVSEAHAQLLGGCRALAWTEDLRNLIEIKPAELCQEHQQHE